MVITDPYRCFDARSDVPAGAPAISGTVASDRSGALAIASANRLMITGRRPQTAKKTGPTWPPLIPPERSSP